MPNGTTPDGMLSAYPYCCGHPTQLRVFGWTCAQCQQTQPFAYTKKGQSMKWGKRLVQQKDQMALKQQQEKEG